MNGWAAETLRQVVEVNYGHSLPDRIRAGDGKIPVCGSNGIVGRHDRAVAKAPAIVIGRKGLIGALNFATEPSWPIDTAYFIDEFPERLLPRRLFLFLSTLSLSQPSHRNLVKNAENMSFLTISDPMGWSEGSFCPAGFTIANEIRGFEAHFLWDDGVFFCFFRTV